MSRTFHNNSRLLAVRKPRKRSSAFTLIKFLPSLQSSYAFWRRSGASGRKKVITKTNNKQTNIHMNQAKLSHAIAIGALAMVAYGSVAFAACTPTNFSTSCVSCLSLDPRHICSGTGSVTGTTYWWCCPDGCACGGMSQVANRDANGNIIGYFNEAYCD